MSTPGIGGQAGAAPRLRWVAGLAVALALAADLLVWPVIAPFGIVPDSTLAVALALAAGGQLRWGMWVALGAGVASDLNAGELIGLGAAGRALAVLAAHGAAKSVSADRFGVTMAIGAASVVTSRLAQHLGALAFGVRVPVSIPTLARGMGFVLLTTALFAVAHIAVSWASLQPQTPGQPARWRP